LELALRALGIGPGDDVVVTSRSFVASASCCALVGARAVFADVDPASQNVTAETIRAALTPRTRAVIVVHLAGWPCEMDPIMQLARRRALAVVEDCAQAHGATYRGKPVGSLGHAAAFSFCQDKILTTGGEGGMLTTNDAELFERAWAFKDHGKNRRKIDAPNPMGVFQWFHDSIGTNWRMTEMQAGIGRVVLRKLPEWLATRRRLAGVLDRGLAAIPGLEVTQPRAHVEHSYYKYYVNVRPEWLRDGWSRDRLVAAVRAEGIPCGSGSCPEIYREEAFHGSEGAPPRRLPVSAELGRTTVMLQVHPTLVDDDMRDVCRVFQKVARAAMRGGDQRDAA